MMKKKTEHSCCSSGSSKQRYHTFQRLQHHLPASPSPSPRQRQQSKTVIPNGKTESEKKDLHGSTEKETCLLRILLLLSIDGVASSARSICAADGGGLWAEQCLGLSRVSRTCIPPRKHAEKYTDIIPGSPTRRFQHFLCAR